jgi:hypothetical protein
MPIGAILPVVGSIAAAGIGALGANSAAKTQAAAARSAAESQLAGLGRAEEFQRGSSGNALEALRAAYGPAMDYIRGATGQAGDYIDLYAHKADAAISSGRQNAVDTLNPYYRTGTSALTSLAQLYGLNGQQAFNDNALDAFRRSPDYAFALEEGGNAVTNQAAARGLLNSGNYLRDLTSFGQGLATQNFGNYANRLASLAGMGQSAGTNIANLFSNEGAQRANIYTNKGNALAGLVTGQGSDLARLITGLGTSEANIYSNQGNVLASLAAQMGSAQAGGTLGAGQANAAGTVGMTNSLTGGINNLTNFAMLQNLLNRPSGSAYAAPASYGAGTPLNLLNMSYGNDNVPASSYGNPGNMGWYG